jgi:hypothetical protein
MIDTTTIKSILIGELHSFALAVVPTHCSMRTPFVASSGNVRFSIFSHASDPDTDNTNIVLTIIASNTSIHILDGNIHLHAFHYEDEQLLTHCKRAMASVLKEGKCLKHPERWQMDSLSWAT